MSKNIRTLWSRGLRCQEKMCMGGGSQEEIPMGGRRKNKKKKDKI